MIHLTKCKTFHYDIPNEFNGIISYFNANSNSNIFDQIVLADASSTLDGRTKPRAVIDIKNIEKHGDWISESVNNSYFTIQFRKHKIQLDSYLLLGRSYDHHHPYHWILEGTNNFNTWEKINEYNNINNPLSEDKFLHVDNINSNTYYSIFRITQIGENTNQNEGKYTNCFSFKGIDLYGKVCQEIYPENLTCKQSYLINKKFYLLLYIIIIII